MHLRRRAAAVTVMFLLDSAAAVAADRQAVDEQAIEATAATAASSTFNPTARAERAAPRKPNIIVFLADDMARSLLRHMPNTRRLIFDKGARFTNFYTNISLCCPSRATMLTGGYAHNTGIRGNHFPDGFHGFHTSFERRRTVAITLKHLARYRTALLGKYLNEYPFVGSRPRFGVRPTFVPRGWSDWAVPVRGQFHGTDYHLNLNGRILHKQARRDYLGDFLNRRALWLIRNNRDRQGLALILSYYGPHAPEPTSPIERNNAALVDRVSRLRVPRTPDFDEANVGDKPRHIRRLPRIGPARERTLDRIYRREIMSVSSIDRYVGMVVRELRRTRQLARTYLVFASDNGLHLGSHRLVNGKNMPYETDVHVPFAIRGPGIAPGTAVEEVVGNIDIAPTLADMAGWALHYRHDGESLLPLAKGKTPAWRGYFYIARGFPFGGSRRAGEFTRPLELRSALPAGLVRYRSVVSRRWQYVRYGTGAEELYDLRSDPFQVRNLLGGRHPELTEREQRVVREHRHAMRRLGGCGGERDCRVR